MHPSMCLPLVPRLRFPKRNKPQRQRMIGPSPLLGLPHELILRVADYLSPRSISSLALTNQYLHQACSRDDPLASVNKALFSYYNEPHRHIRAKARNTYSSQVPRFYITECSQYILLWCSDIMRDDPISTPHCAPIIPRALAIYLI